MVKKYLLFVKKKWETIEICPHPPPTDPLPGKAERSGNAVEKQKNLAGSVRCEITWRQDFEIFLPRLQIILQASHFISKWLHLFILAFIRPNRIWVIILT